MISQVQQQKVVDSIVGWLAHLEVSEPEAFSAITGFFANPGFKTLEISANDNRIVFARCSLNFRFENGSRRIGPVS